MNRTPDKMDLLEINANIEQTGEEISANEKKLIGMQDGFAKKMLKKSICFAKKWIFRLETEEQKRFDRGETTKAGQNSDND